MSDKITDISELNTVFELLPMPVCTTNNKRIITHINEAAKEAFPNMELGQNLAFYLREPDFLKACDEVIATGEKAEVDIEELGPPKRFFKVCIKGFNGGSVMLLFSDVTIAVESEKARSTFVANVSHELRSPLTTLMGCIETLQGPAKDDPNGQTRFLGLMEQEANRMKRIVNDLLSLAKSETTAHLAPNQQVDMVEILNRTASVLEPQAQKKGMKITQNINSDTAMVMGERDQLIQVMHNLVDNAIKYGDEKSEIIIELSGDEKIMQFSVANKGAQIASEKLPRLTERFYRLDKGRSRDVGGTGLGLAIVKHIINRHRGELNITSDKNGITKFSISLPSA